jgi:hypothetical protein
MTTKLYVMIQYFRWRWEKLLIRDKNQLLWLEKVPEIGLSIVQKMYHQGQIVDITVLNMMHQQ